MGVTCNGSDVAAVLDHTNSRAVERGVTTSKKSQAMIPWDAGRNVDHRKLPSVGLAATGQYFRTVRGET